MRQVSPQNKNEEKLKRRTAGTGAKLQLCKSQVGVKKKHSWQSQQLNTGRGSPERLGKPSIFGDLFKGPLDRAWKSSSVLDVCVLLSRGHSWLSAGSSPAPLSPHFTVCSRKTRCAGLQGMGLQGQLGPNGRVSPKYFCFVGLSGFDKTLLQKACAFCCCWVCFVLVFCLTVVTVFS